MVVMLNVAVVVHGGQREREIERGGWGGGGPHSDSSLRLSQEPSRNDPQACVHTQSVSRIIAGRESAESEYIKSAAPSTPLFPSLI